MRRRSGFTIVELLVVVGILILLATMTFAVFNAGRSSDRMRSSARVAQSAFLGAKDRALHAKDLRGVRLIRDLNDITLVNGFAYLQPRPTQITGNLPGAATLNNVAVVVNGLPNPSIQVLIAPPVGDSWYQQDQNGFWPNVGVQVRIPANTGAWYNLQRVSNSAPYWGTQVGGNLVLTLAAAFDPISGNQVAPAPAVLPLSNVSGNASCELRIGNDVLPFHQPMPLSSGVVIDLKYSGGGVQSMVAVANGSYLDIMFSPRGSVVGPIAAQGPLHFLLRDIQDASDTNVNPLAVGAPGSANPDLNKGDRMVLTVFPQTGLVQTFEIDPTDNVNNATNAAGADGLADNIFNFAQQGKSAGK